MAQTKIDLFFLLNGLDGHLELVPGEGENALSLLSQTAHDLVAMGAQPRPQPARGGGSGAWQSKQKQFVPGEKCPNCGSGIIEKSGVSKKTGKPWCLWICDKGGEDCFKNFQDLATSSAPAPASTGGTVPKKIQPPAPVQFQPRPTPVAASAPTAPKVEPRATMQQIKKVRGLAALLGVSDKKLLTRCNEYYGVSQLEQLSAANATDLAARLKRLELQLPRKAREMKTRGKRKSEQVKEVTVEELAEQEQYLSAWKRLVTLTKTDVTPDLFEVMAKALDIMQWLAETENQGEVSYFEGPFSAPGMEPPLKAALHLPLREGETFRKEVEVDPVAVALLKRMGYLQPTHFVWVMNFYKLSQTGLELLAGLKRILL